MLYVLLIFLSLSVNATDSFLKEAYAGLPMALRNSVVGHTVAFEKLDEYPRLQNPCEVKESKQVFGKLEGKRIILNQNFLPYLDASSEEEHFPCGHRNFRRLALATFIHEATHAWDLQNKMSSLPTYQALAAVRNQKASRSPDPYEYKSIAEHLAVNMEYYVLDHEYACRRPNLNQFFNQSFSQRGNHCQNFTPVSFFDGESAHEVSLDPQNVLEISYVLAGKGEPLMSRFGHALFKLKMRPPLKDLSVGFVGQVDESVMSHWKGLSGKYPSRLFIAPYSSTVKNYTKHELRDLTEAVLTFTSEQKNIFLQQIVTLHYEYSGKYYFFKNNCATEAMNLLKAVIRDPVFQIIKVKTPIGVFKALERLRLIDKSRVSLVSSHWPTMEKIFTNARSTLPGEDLTSYWSKDPSERRMAIRLGSETTKKNIIALMALESAILERDFSRLESVMLEEVNALKSDDPLRRSSQDALIRANRLSFGEITSQGYGIPLRSEDSQLEDRTQKAQELTDFYQSLGSWAKDQLQDHPMARTYRAGEENYKWLSQKLSNFSTGP